MKKRSLSKLICFVLSFCAATAMPSPPQILTAVHSFEGPDGENPYGGLLRIGNGAFYGTTAWGGANGCCGTVFTISPSGRLTTLHTFDQSEGHYSHAALVRASDGNLYGTNPQGGTQNNNCGFSGCGTIFKVTLDGILTTLHSFDGADGGNPWGALVQGTDGNLYGTTSYGGDLTCNAPYGCGTVFRITMSGTLSTLHSFEGPDGSAPVAGLVEAADGTFYGTTAAGGDAEQGTVFSITPQGFLLNLHSFGGPVGSSPSGWLVEGSDGSFYGTTSGGGTYGDGTVFKITPSGTLTTLYSFAGHPDGSSPCDGLVKGTDGNFYGTTEFGGATHDWGTVFRITPVGTLTTLYSFDVAKGAYPYAGLVQGADGSFYGTTYGGGQHGYGTVFRLVLLRPCTLCRTTE